MERDYISSAVVKRLPRYYRHLNDLIADGVIKISSRMLAENLGLTASQIRQDLNCFGGFGQQGYGYNAVHLRDSIAQILGIPKNYNAIIIGAGNVGHALINNFEFTKIGLTLTAVFDVSPSLVGDIIGGHTVRHVNTAPEFIKTARPEIAILTLPGNIAPAMASELVGCGIKGLLNFTNVDLHIEAAGVKVENVHFADSFLTLSYKITNE